MKLYAIARAEDLLKANSHRLRRVLREDASSYARIADGRVPPAFAAAVARACEAAGDRPEVRAWSHTVSLLQGFGEGQVPVPHSSIIGHLDLDSPRVSRVIEMLAWELCAASFDELDEPSVTLDSPPPRVLPVGRRGAFTCPSHWPAEGKWTLARSGHAVELRGAIGLLESHVDEGWLVPVRAQASCMDAVVPLHQPSLMNRDFQDFPIVRARAYAENWIESVAGAADTVTRYSPVAAGLVQAFISAIVPLLCGETAIGSASREHALGLVFLPAIDQHDQMVECLLHEALHQYLFRLEECGPVYTESTTTEERFYSPWRPDPRSLRMTLHGAFVFTAVADLYLWPEAPRELGLNEHECHRRAYHRAQQVQLALRVVRRFAELARFGRVIVEAVERDVASIMERADPSKDDRADADAEIATHLQRHADYLR